MNISEGAFFNFAAQLVPYILEAYKIVVYNKPAHEKRGHSAFLFTDLQMRMHSVLFVATDMRFLPNAASRSLLYVCEHRPWRDSAYTQARLFWSLK